MRRTTSQFQVSMRHVGKPMDAACTFCDPWEVRLLVERRKDDSETSNSKLCQNNFNEPILSIFSLFLSSTLVSSLLCRRTLLFPKTRDASDPVRNDFRFTSFRRNYCPRVSDIQYRSNNNTRSHTAARVRMENSDAFRDNTIVTTLIYIPAANTESRL